MEFKNTDGSVSTGKVIMLAESANAPLKADPVTSINPLPVVLTAPAGALAVDIAQVNGVTTQTGAGTVGTGTQRVAIGTDATTIAGSAPGVAGSASANVLTVQGAAGMTKLLVTPDSVALPANQSVNAAQINGVAPLMGNGVTGTGSPRVTIASDNTPFAVKIDQTTPGTTDAVTLKVGTAIVGKVGIDQTTPGTTNAVQDAATVAQASTTSGQLGQLIQGATTTFVRTDTTGKTNPLSLTVAGSLRTSIMGTVTNEGDAPISATQFIAGGVDQNAKTALNVIGQMLSFNPLPATPQVEPWKSNFDTAALVTLATAAAGTTNSADQTNTNGRGVQVLVDITATTGQTLTVSIQGKDNASGKYYTILSSAALAAVASTNLTVYPGSTVAVNLDASAPLPRVWRISAVVGGAGSTLSATIGASVIN